jgi:Carboxypeptidase regulatory-like domain
MMICEVTRVMLKSFSLTVLSLLAILFSFAGQLPAQTGAGRIFGNASDPAGARVAQAAVSAKSADGQASSAKTDSSGTFELAGLRPGKYTISVTAPGFEVAAKDVLVVAGQSQKLEVSLAIAKREEKIDVRDETTRVDTDPTNNAGAIVLKEKDLEMLSEDPDELKLQLQMMAGASAGGLGGQIYVDGFSGSRLPPKSAIREIRINQDPFSAEYDRPGFGRIEVLTKPGASQFHSLFSYRYNNSKFNSTSPFSAQRPVYHTELFSGSLGGPLTSRSSFQFDIDRNSVNDSSIITASILDASFNPLRFSQAVPNPRLFTAVGFRVDYQINPNNIFFARYEYAGQNEKNDGTGQFALASQGFDITKGEHTFQFSDTMILSSRMTNETRFQYRLVRDAQTPQSALPQTSVAGAFIGGGSNLGSTTSDQHHYEFQDYTSIDTGKHFVRFGGQLRLSAETDSSTANFNGTFTFPSLNAFQITQGGLNAGLSPQQIRAAGGGAEQFSIIAGQPKISNAMFDAGAFVLDNWKLRPNVIFGFGLRYELQNEIHDLTNLAPRLSLAWGIHPGKKSSPKSVLRLGFGVFYTRFGQSLALSAQQLNGDNQRKVIVQNPDFFPNIPSAGELANSLTSPAIYRIDPGLRAPYTIQSSVSYERQLPKATRLAVTYLNSRGGRQLLSTNINAPLPGTFDIADPASGVRPLPNSGNIYQYEARGRFEQNQLTVNLTTNGLSKARLNGSYTLSFANSNTAGANSFPSNQFDINQDYGRASYDVRHQLNFGGQVDLPLGFYINPFLLFSSGQPFNISLGRDLNGDSIFNDRPAFATDLSRSSVVKTRYGVFDTAPLPGQRIIPPNLATGPARFTINLRLVKAFALGKKEISSPDTADNKKHESIYKNAWRPLYAIRFELIANNAFNLLNLATPVGNLSSPFFGSSISLAGGPFSTTAAKRQIILRTVFRF